MKHLNLIWFLASLASAGEPSVQSFTLDEHSVRVIPVSRTRVTTFCFPSAPQAISGSNLTADGRTPGTIQFDFKPGSFFFTVRALAPGAVANLNVLWNRRVYVFELTESNVPVLSVLLEPPVIRTVAPSAVTVSPTRLLGLLQMAKAQAALAAHHPSALQGVTSIKPKRICDYGDFLIHVEQVFRFDEEDTLVFRLRLENRSNAPIRYRAGSFVLRVGDRLFSQSISDASGLLSPNTDQPVWFAVTGLPDGSRHELSLNNDFIVLVSRESIP